MGGAGPRTRRELLLTVLGVLLCLALAGGLVALYFWTGRRNGLILLFAGLVLALWAVPFYVRVRRLVATRHFTRSELVLGTHRPGLGEPVRVQLTLAARRSIQLEGVRFVLRSFETVGAGRKTRSAEVTRVEVTRPDPVMLEPDSPRVFEGEVTVPSDGMESFEGHGASLKWELAAFALVGGVPVPLDSQELIVQPRRTGRPSPPPPPEISAGDELQLSMKPGMLQVGSMAHLEVTVPEPLPASGASLDLSLSWQVRKLVPAEPEEHTVFAKTVTDFASGQGIGFDLLVPPAGPMSYQGKLFDITWTARAALRAPNGQPIETTELPITVDPHVEDAPWRAA